MISDSPNMFRLTPVLVLCLAAAAMGKVRTSKRPGFMMGNPLYDPVWEDDEKIVGGEEVVPGSRPYQLSFQVWRPDCILTKSKAPDAPKVT